MAPELDSVDHVNLEPEFPTHSAQQRHVAGTSPPESMVVPDDEFSHVHARAQQLHETFGRKLGERPGEWDEDHDVNAGLREDLSSLVRCR